MEHLKRLYSEVKSLNGFSRYGSINDENGSSTASNDTERAESDNSTDEDANPSIVTVKQKMFAMFMYCLATISYNVSISSTQVLAGAVPPLELNVWRYGVQVVISVLLNLCRRKCDIKIQKSKLLVLLGVFVAYSITNITIYTASIYLPLGSMFGSYLSLMVIINATLSICIKAERRAELYASAMLAILGIHLMTQPRFIFPAGLFPPPPETNFTSPCTLETQTFVDSSKEWVGYVLILVTGIVHTGALYGIRNVMTEMSSFSFAFWNALFGAAVSAVFMGIFERPVVPTSAVCLLLLFGHCLGTTHESLAVPYALKYISPTLTILIRASNTVLLLVLQYTVLKDINPGNRNWLEIVGGVVTLAAFFVGPIVHIVKEYRSEKEKKAENTEPKDLVGDDDSKE